MCAQDLQGVHCLRARADDGPNVFKHAQVVSDRDAEDLYYSGSLDTWYWRRRLNARLSAFVEENDFQNISPDLLSDCWPSPTPRRWTALPVYCWRLWLE